MFPFLFLQIGTMTVCMHSWGILPCIKHTLNRLLRWLHTLESAQEMCSAKMPSLPAARFSGSLCSRDLILKLLHISSSIPSKLLCEFIFWSPKLPIPQFFLWVQQCWKVFSPHDSDCFISCFSSHCRWKPWFLAFSDALLTINRRWCLLFVCWIW